MAASDVVEALDVWAARPVDVVVADYQLPGMTGLDLLVSLLGRFFHHPPPRADQ